MLENFIKKSREQHPDTYIFLFGDHTPYVLNSGPYQRASFMLDDHAFEFVPLFIITPDNAARIETERAVSFLDIAPTILKNSNVNYTYSIMGENILGGFGDILIPYKGKQYDRKELFRLAQKTVLR
jgi:phosphoglycerol transferase MdoB-like AlkP superfamily enzyme